MFLMLAKVWLFQADAPVLMVPRTAPRSAAATRTSRRMIGCLATQQSHMTRGALAI